MTGDELATIVEWAQTERPETEAAVVRLVAEVESLRALSARLREQLQHECPHGEMSWSGVDQTPLDDPAKVWACDNCGKVLDA